MAHSPLIRDTSPVVPSDSPPRHRPVLLARWLEEGWAGELFAVCCSCVFVIGLCVMLKQYDGQPVPSFGTWFNTGITLGTLVALLTTLAVATALSAAQECISQLKWLRYAGSSRPLRDVETYDRASRGIWGSVLLLWKLRCPPIASLGALLVIANLAMVPLAQQSILYVSVPIVTDPHGATVPVRMIWEDAGTQAPAMPEGLTAISSGMKGAILMGLYAPGNIDDTPPHCTSGNCTIEAYNSLALCPSTADVTSQLQNMSSGAIEKWCLPGGFCAGGALRNRLDEGDGTSIISAAASGDNENLSSNLAPLNYTSLAFPDHPSPVADFYIIYPNYSAPHGEMIMRHGQDINGTGPEPWAAVEFVIDWCVLEFSTQVVNGTAVTTRAPNPYMNFTQGLMDFGSYFLWSFGTGRIGGAEYTIHPLTHFSLQRHMNLTLAAGSDQVDRLALQFGRTTRAESLSALDGLLSNMATSMTNYMRTTAPDDHANGTVWAERNTVHISWSWLAAPVLFSATSTLLLLIVMVLSRGAVQPPRWKSSALATMRCLDPRLQDELGAPPGLAAMRHATDREKVRLMRDSSGWLLVRGEPLEPSDKSSGRTTSMNRDC